MLGAESQPLLCLFRTTVVAGLCVWKFVKTDLGPKNEKKNCMNHSHGKKPHLVRKGLKSLLSWLIYVIAAESSGTLLAGFAFQTCDTVMPFILSHGAVTGVWNLYIVHSPAL